METGTGKTYVYLRTIFELSEKYNFKKFIILVPRVAIREGVSTSIRLMKQHFRDLYPGQPFDFSVYSGASAEEVQSFATSTNVQILVMTIDSIRGDKNSRVIHQTRDKLNGLRPIDYLKASHPIVIMDEPQNMESVLSQTSIQELDPLATLRYSATHRKLRNVLYRLDPVDAHDLGLVKQIVVAEVLQQGTDAKPYIKLVDVSRDPWVAKIELLCRKADGSIEKQVKKIKQGQDLAVVSGYSAYANNWRVNEISLDPPSVELTNHGLLNVGEEIGGNSDSIYREMIRETIREHLRKEELLRSQNIKVLSLFFIDKVANFLGEGTNNHDADGPFVKWFDELLLEERAKSDTWKALLPQDPHELRSAYFSQIKRGKNTTYQDSSGETKADDDAYDLIMRDKERLLDQSEPVRFIFSHSALREGWDNPNVFQICTLREMGKETERRQTIGRGLRLPVNQDGERIGDRGICQLTVIANESYLEFAKNLQSDYVKAGVEIGKIRIQEFSKIVLFSDDENFAEDDRFGFDRSQEIYNHLTSNGFIKEGLITAKYQPNELGFTLNLPSFYAPYEAEIVDIIGRASMERYVKPASKRQARRLNKQLFDDPVFEEFWHAISRRTTYRVSVNREKLVEQAVKAIKAAPEIDPLSIHVTKAGVKIVRGGTKASETSSRIAELRGTYELPDIIAELQESTSLTRKTIVEILCESGRLQEFIDNPNDYIQMVKVRINNVMATLVIDGIQYEQISGSVYELRELQKDGLEEKDRFIDQLYEVQNRQKSDFDYLVLDSAPEREFAKLLDSREDVRLFMKLPAKFKIPTPVGDYNPDWAILKQVDGQDRIYMIRETKSTLDEMKRRPLENAKIESAKKHFEAIGISDYEVSAPGSWHL
jgi:type III restriction enzyme